MTATGACHLLEWDSQFFARRLARLTSPAEGVPDWAEIEAWCRAQAVEGLHFLCPAENTALVRFAEAHRFQLTDIRLTLECPLDTPPPIPQTGVPIRRARAGDLPALQALARTSHQQTRFFRDGRLPAARCAELYAIWIATSLADPAAAVWVAEGAGRLAGYCAGGRATPQQGQIGLLAVDASQRRLGLGRALMAQTLAWAHQQGFRTVRVVTQGGCASSQRFYQACGFVPVEVGLWYHRWLTPA